jgi:glycosyltransferase involved in cell wall biosynthesis
VFNDAACLGKRVHRLFNLFIPRLHILIVDDGSTDETRECCDQLATQFLNRVFTIHCKVHQGDELALLEGFQYALRYNVDYIVPFEVCSPLKETHILTLFEHHRQYDVVSLMSYTSGEGIHQAPGDYCSNYSHWSQRVYAPKILGFNISGRINEISCWSAPALRAVIQHPIFPHGVFFQMEMAHLALRLGFKVCEFSLDKEDRLPNHSRNTFRRHFSSFWQTLILRLSGRSVSSEIESNTDNQQALPRSAPQQAKTSR